MGAFTRIDASTSSASTFAPPPAGVLRGCALTCLAAAALSPALACAADAESGENSGQLAEITVTATRRAEPLQRVPVAVSVLTGSEAASQNLNNVQDISAVLPTVDFRTGASNKDRDVFIRGIGTITTSPGVEPSVSTVIDGVVLARPGQATVELLDVDRIEVLRGPQGTLFGKNASAGVINIVTTDPSQDVHGYADAGYFGGGDEYRIKGGISGGLVEDKLLGSISAVYSHYDGNVSNLFNGETLNGYERYGVHTKLVLKATDDLRVVFNGDYMHSTDTVPTGVPSSSSQIAYPTHIVTPNAGFAQVLAASGLAPSLQSTDVSQNVDSNVRDKNGGASITADYAFGGGYTLTSITGYRKWQNDQDQDYDQISQLTSAFPQVEDHGYLSFYQVSQEARVASPKGGFIDYQAGIYYMHAVDTETYHRDITQLTAGAFVPNSGTSNYGTTGNNYSIFGEGNLNFTDSFRGVLGARVVRDTLDYHFQRASTSLVAVPAISPSFASSGSTSDYGYTDRVGLQYDINKDVNTYLTYSRGYTGPAYNVFFNMAASATNALKPETSNAYELGLKSRTLNGRLQLNLALFLTDFDNYQANFQDVLNGALVTRLINAGSVSTRGLEADFAYRPLEQLTLSGAAARTRARVDQFNCPPQAATSCNINGQPLPFAPDWKFNLDANYVIPVSGSLQVVLDTDYHWQSQVQYQLTETPDTIQAAYGIWDGSIALADSSRGWRVSALIKNITDKSYSAYLAHGDLAGVMRWLPRDASRYAGIDISKTF